MTILAVAKIGTLDSREETFTVFFGTTGFLAITALFERQL